MRKIRYHFNSLAILLIKMSLIVTALDLIISIFDNDFEFYDLLLSLLINCIGVFIVYNLAVKMPPTTKPNPLTIQDNILDLIYSDVLQDLHLDEKHRGIFSEYESNNKEEIAKEYKSIDNPEEIFTMMNTYQKILVNISSDSSMKLYANLEKYKSEAKYMIDNPENLKAFIKKSK